MPANFLNRTDLPSITGLAASGADIAKPKNSAAIGDHRHEVAARGVAAGSLGIGLDLETGLGHAGAVGSRQIAAIGHRLGRADLQFTGFRKLVIIQRRGVAVARSARRSSSSSQVTLGRASNVCFSSRQLAPPADRLQSRCRCPPVDPARNQGLPRLRSGLEPGAHLVEYAFCPRFLHLRDVVLVFQHAPPACRRSPPGLSADRVERQQAFRPVDGLGHAGLLEQILVRKLHEGHHFAAQRLGGSGARGLRISISRSKSG